MPVGRTRPTPRPHTAAAVPPGKIAGGSGAPFQVSSNLATSRAIRTVVRNSHRSNVGPNSRRAPLNVSGFVDRHCHSSPRHARGYVRSPAAPRAAPRRPRRSPPGVFGLCKGGFGGSARRLRGALPESLLVSSTASPRGAIRLVASPVVFLRTLRGAPPGILWRGSSPLIGFV